jgi:hypothetical protein
MAVSRVKKVIEEIKKFTATEKIEFFRSLITEGILDNKDEFNEEEMADIRAAMREVARGEWVDFDEFRKSQNL